MSYASLCEDRFLTLLTFMQDIGDLIEALLGYFLITRDEIDLARLVPMLRALDIPLATLDNPFRRPYRHRPPHISRSRGILQRERDVQELCNRLGYQFQNASWIALIFVSAVTLPRIPLRRSGDISCQVCEKPAGLSDSAHLAFLA